MSKEAPHTKSGSQTTLRLVPEIGLVDLADPSLPFVTATSERLAEFRARAAG